MVGEVQSLVTATPHSMDKPVAGEVDSAQRAADAQRRASEQEAASPDLNEVVESLNENIEVLRRALQFSVDDDSGQTVVKVLDADTEEVIRQIPSEEVLELQKRLEDATGFIFRGKA